MAARMHFKLSERHQQMIAAMIMVERHFSLEWDENYGTGRRHGWTVLVDRRVIVQFASTPEDAVERAYMDRIERWQKCLVKVQETGG